MDTLLLTGKTQEEIIGFATMNRDLVHGKDRKLFNFICHSRDINPHIRGKNKFAGDWDDDKLDTVRNILEEKIIKHKLEGKITKHPLDEMVMPVIMENQDKSKKINKYKEILEQDIDSVKKNNIKLNKYIYLYENLYNIFTNKGWCLPGNNAVIGNEVTKESVESDAKMMGLINSLLMNDEPMGQELQVSINLMLMMMEAQIPTYNEYKEIKEKNIKYHNMLKKYFKGI